MTNREKYDSAFIQTFVINKESLAELKYQAIAAWDSVGHMALMAALEDAFGIELDIDDIIGFSSYDVGMATLGKYGITL